MSSAGEVGSDVLGEGAEWSGRAAEGRGVMVPLEEGSAFWGAEGGGGGGEKEEDREDWRRREGEGRSASEKEEVRSDEIGSRER